MTRSRTKTGEFTPVHLHHSSFRRIRDDIDLLCPFSLTAPHEFTSVPFPLKALKLLLHDVQSGGDSATIPPPDDVDSDDGVTSSLG